MRKNLNDLRRETKRTVLRSAGDILSALRSDGTRVRRNPYHELPDDWTEKWLRLEGGGSYFSTLMHGLLVQNLKDHPERIEILRLCRGRVAFELSDLQVTITIVFGETGVTVQDGLVGIPDLRFEMPSDTVLRMSRIEWLAGRVPDPRGSEVRALWAGLRAGSWSSKGTLVHLPLAYRLMRLFAV